MHQPLSAAFPAAFFAFALGSLGPTEPRDDFEREGSPERRAALAALEGEAPPPLAVKGWLNTGGRPLELGALRGKVVVLDFWGTWCGPCRRAIPKLAELHARHEKEGLVVIGVHTTRGAEKLAEFVAEHELPYPVCVDQDERTVSAYQVDSYPDYYLVDRSGTLRVADLANRDLERAVQILLAEPAPVREPELPSLVRDWPGGSFHYVAGGETLGTFSFRHEAAELDGRRVVRMHDVLRIATPEGRASFEVLSLCEDDAHFTPIHLHGRVQQGEEEGRDFALSFADGRVSGDFGGREVAHALPPGATTDVAILRVASRMPFAAGEELRVPVFDLERMQPAGVFVLACKDEQQLDVGGTSIPAWRIERKAEGRTAMELWFGADRRLLRARWADGRELLPAP